MTPEQMDHHDSEHARGQCVCPCLSDLEDTQDAIRRVKTASEARNPEPYSSAWFSDEQAAELEAATKALWALVG